ncbi:MAG: AAA family ATPase, partial [Bacteroidota bacterium]
DHRWTEAKEQDLLMQATSRLAMIEVGQKVQALQAFKTFLQSEAGLTCDYFGSPEDLATKVMQAVAEVTPNRESASVAQSPVSPRVADDAEARRVYLERLVAFCQELPLASLDDRPGADEVTLDDVYITLNTTAVKDDREGIPGEEIHKQRLVRRNRDPFGRSEKPDPLSAHEALAKTPKLVLLGKPGSGKSTFVKRILERLALHQLGREPQPPEGLDADLVPLFVLLRDLAPHLAGLTLDNRAPQRRRQFADAVAAYLTGEDAAVDANDYAEALRQRLRQGRCLIVFDGLDEVPDAQRALVREAVTAVQRVCRTPHTVVTCRVRSYEDAQLPDFQPYTLASFTRDQIRAFCEAWYKAKRGMPSRERDEKIGDLIDAIERDGRIAELAATPMLLTTLALVHQANVKLPPERVRLYRRAVKVLLHRWQKHKGMTGPSAALQQFLEDEGPVRKVMEHLAAEAHASTPDDTDEAADIERGRALVLIEETCGQRDIAAGFLDYVDQRAGILMGRGNREPYPKVYSFPHRTFQEYLAGCHLFDLDDPEGELMRRAALGDRWSVAVQLGAEDLRHSDNARDQRALRQIATTMGGLQESTPDWERLMIWSGNMAALLGK